MNLRTSTRSCKVQMLSSKLNATSISKVHSKTLSNCSSWSLKMTCWIKGLKTSRSSLTPLRTRTSGSSKPYQNRSSSTSRSSRNCQRLTKARLAKKTMRTPLPVSQTMTARSRRKRKWKTKLSKSKSFRTTSKRWGSTNSRLRMN